MKATFISRFTPSSMTPEVLEGIFVQRQQLAQHLVELIRDSAITPAKHYTLLIGPRGIGKTHLVSLIYHRISKMEDLRDRLLIAWLREEEWSITSFLKLLLRIFAAIEKEYPEEYNTKLKQKVEALYQSPETAEYTAADLLKEFIENRTLLLLIENLDEVFAGLGESGQKRFRAFLQQNDFFTIVATSPSLFNGVKLRKNPFYGFFRIRELKDLTPEDATQLLINVAKLESDRELESFIQTPTGQARIKAVHHLAGGNPRVYVIFSQFLTRELLDELVEPFMRTLDNLTPYYQSRMVHLSPQQRGIVDFLCDRRYAVTVKEIAQCCFITHQTASSQLKNLREMGYVYAESIGGESYYELKEPLMRFCMDVKKQRREPIRLFVDFLRCWYSQTELQQRLEVLPDDVLEREYLLKALEIAKEDGEDPRVMAYLYEYENYLHKNDFIQALEVTQKLVKFRGQTLEWILQGYCLKILGHCKEAQVSLDKAIEMDAKNIWAWYGQILISVDLERYEEALKFITKVIELDPQEALVWFQMGKILVNLGRNEEAWECYQKVVELNPNETEVWLERGYLLVKLGRYEESLESFNKVIELEDQFSEEFPPYYATIWNNRAWVLCQLGRYEQALISLEKAINLGYRDRYVFLNRAGCLLVLSRWDEGILALEKALSYFADVDVLNIDNTKAILNNLFNFEQDREIWKTLIKTLISLYERYKVISTLGQGLVASIPMLMSEVVNDKAVRTWLEVWQKLTSDRSEFQIPIRFLNIAVRYRESKSDRRILLELPIEERNLLKPLLDLSEGTQ